MKKKIQYKTFGFQFKAADDESGIVEGYASTFGNVDLGLDVVDKGAFKKTLTESRAKIPILADHNPSKQIGWNLDGSEDDKGLFVKGELDVKVNQLARERYSLSKKAMEIGAKAGLSIGYMTIKGEPDSENPRIRRLKELKLMEYSFVTFPMNTEAMVTAAKSWLENGDLGLEDATDWFFKHMEQLGHKPVEIFEALRNHEAAKNLDQHSHIKQCVDAADRAIALLRGA